MDIISVLIYVQVIENKSASLSCQDSLKWNAGNWG